MESTVFDAVALALVWFLCGFGLCLLLKPLRRPKGGMRVVSRQPFVGVCRACNALVTDSERIYCHHCGGYLWS